MSKTIAAARWYLRMCGIAFNGIKVAMSVPIVAGLTYGLVTFLWLSILLPGGALR